LDENPAIVLVGEDVFLQLIAELAANVDVLSIAGVALGDLLAVLIIRVVRLPKLAVLVPGRVLVIIRLEREVQRGIVVGVGGHWGSRGERQRRKRARKRKTNKTRNVY
jgi:hypothetical protein